MSSHSPESMDVDRFLRRVERLARKLLSADFDDANALWTFQESLLRLQRDVQEAITEAKRSRSDRTGYAILTSLRTARWHARRLGDAFAWILLNFDRKVIRSLAGNSRVPVSREDHGTRGLMAITGHLAGQGWGFPLLHDVTDCLRVGDVTFIKPGEESLEYQTVEVKTRIISEQPTEDGKTTYEYEVAVLLPSEFDTTPSTGASGHAVWQGVTTPGPSNTEVGAAEPSHRRRLDRQLLRMSKARKRQLAEDGTLTELEGEASLLTTHFESEASSHWRTLRRIIRNARGRGYASDSVDGAFLYVAFYHPNGFDEDALGDSALVQDLLGSEILFQGKDKERNALVITGVPPHEGIGAQPFLPYFLYTIPKKAIFDLLHGRLTIIVLSNAGRVFAALEEDGFDVSLPTRRHDLSAGSFVIATEVNDALGGSYVVELHNMSFHVSEVLHEFKSLDYLVEVMRSTRDTVKKVIAEPSKAEGQ